MAEYRIWTFKESTYVKKIKINKKTFVKTFDPKKWLTTDVWERAVSAILSQEDTSI